MTSTADSKDNYSKPFEIYQHASAGGPITVQFKLNRGKPVMLGDGSYGAVYEGLGQNKNLAIKVLYDNERMRPRRLSDIDLDYDLIIKQIHDKKLDVGQVLTLIKSHNGPDFTLLETIKNNYSIEGRPLKDDEWNKLAPNFRNLLQKLTDLVNSSAVYRFESEYKATKYLQDSNERRGFGREITGLVEVWGRNEEFTTLLDKNGPLHDIRAHFEGADQSIKFSNYVLVMDKYNFSLKDLLERPYRNLVPQVISLDDKTETADQSGYEVLQNLPHDLRAREALMLLKDVAHGLHLLHNVNYYEPFFHLDIKPGNIMIKMKDNQEFDVALADLGNLPLINQPSQPAERKLAIEPKEALQPILFLGTAEAPPGHDYAPGTHHYRSPEQKYYMDVANVQVVHSTVEEIQKSFSSTYGKDFIGSESILTLKNTADESIIEERATEEMEKANTEWPETASPKTPRSSSNTQVILVVEDPKFENTLIESGDVIVFSKDNARRPFTIDEIISVKNGTFLLYTLSVDLAKNESLVLAEAEKTQVEFYKKQKFRTDLFGVGAVAFDLMTAGRSPEKFYESIRKFEVLSIDEIIKQYDTLSRGEIEGENPDLAEIFAPFKDENSAKRYPDKDIVEFILKCMLYQSKGTFYDSNSEDPRKASSEVKARVEDLLETYKARNQSSHIRTDESILIHRPQSLNIAKVENIKLLSHEISRLQGLSEWDVISNIDDTKIIAANRLLYGCHYLLQVYEFIRKMIIPGVSPPPPYFQQILPSYVTLTKKGREVKLQFDSSPSRQTREDFLIKELRDNQLDQVVRSSTNPYIPNMLAQTRRKVRLIAKSQEASSGNTLTFTYRFRDAAVIPTKVAPGDWIVSGNGLWEIISPVTENELTLKNEEFETGKPFDFMHQKQFACTYFCSVDPLKYYLEMLAVYLHHLVFAYSPLTTATRDRVDIRALLNVFEISNKTIFIQEPKRIEGKKKNSSNEVEYIYSRYLYLFLKLILHESEDSFYKQIVRDTDQIQPSTEIKKTTGYKLNLVRDYAADLYQNIQKLLGYNESMFDCPEEPITSLDNMPIQSMLEELIETPYDLEIAIKRRGMIAYE